MFPGQSWFRSQADRCFRQPPLDVRFRMGLPEEAPDDPLDLPPPLPERRHYETRRKPRDQITAKHPIRDRCTQVPIRRRDDADVGISNRR